MSTSRKRQNPSSSSNNIDPSNVDVIHDFVYQEYKRGLNKAQIFLNVCKLFGYPKKTLSKVNEWFEKYERYNHRSLAPQISPNYKYLITVIYDTFHPSLDKLIKDQMKETENDKILSFQNASNRLNYPTISNQEIEKLFMRYLSNDETLNEERENDEIKKGYFELVKEITRKIIEEKRLLFKLERKKLVQCRYGFDRSTNYQDRNDKAISITDYYHNQTRNLKIKNALLTFYVRFELLNQSYFLIIENIRGTEVSILQLVKFDLTKNTCEVTDDTFGEFGHYSILQDEKDMSKFIFLSMFHDGSKIFLVIGDFKTGKIVSKQNIQVKNHGNTLCLRLVDNQMSGLKYVSNYYNSHSHMKRFVYWTMPFKATEKMDDKEMEPKSLFQFDLEIHADINYNYHGISYYAWKKDVCFMALYTNLQQENLYAFYVNFQKCVLLNFAQGLYFESVYLRDDGCLICCDRKDDVYCFTLDKAQSLGNIVWSSIKKRSKKLSEYAWGVMPLNSKLQPFHIRDYIV